MSLLLVRRACVLWVVVLIQLVMRGQSVGVLLECHTRRWRLAHQNILYHTWVQVAPLGVLDVALVKGVR